MIRITSILLLAVLCSCAAIEENPLTAQLITSQTTLRFIEAADDPRARAALVAERVGQLAAVLDEGAISTIDGLEAYIRAQIDWSQYGIADQDLLNFGITLAAQELERRAGTLQLNPESTIRIRTLLEWVALAAARVQ